MFGEPLHGSTGDSQQPSPQIVLVVEDDDLTIEFMRTILKSQYTIRTAASSAEAWEVLRAHQVDLIIMDISINGDQSGLELTRDIRRSPGHADIPIVVLTAHAFEEDRMRSLEAGCDVYVRKPIKSTELRAIIAERISKRTQRT